MIDGFLMHIINDEKQKIMCCYGNFEKYESRTLLI